MKKSISISHVIFDLDGTLTDTEKYFQIAWSEALDHFGYQPEREILLSLRSLGSPYARQFLANKYGENFPYEEVRKYRTEVFEQKIDRYGIPLKPYAVELLQWLSENKYIIALATSGNSERAERFLRIAKIIQYFDAIVCSDIVQKGKPSPDTYSTACIILGTEPDSVVAVEDSPNGVESAYSAGCNVIMVPDFTAPDPRTRDKLYACVNSLRDIIDILS